LQFWREETTCEASLSPSSHGTLRLLHGTYLSSESCRRKKMRADLTLLLIGTSGGGYLSPRPILTCLSGEGNDPFSSPLRWEVREEKGRHLSRTKENFATRQLLTAETVVGGIHAIRLVNLPHPWRCSAVVYCPSCLSEPSPEADSWPVFCEAAISLKADISAGASAAANVGASASASAGARAATNTALSYGDICEMVFFRVSIRA